MNQLISSICMLAILFNCTIRLLIILLYIIGPLPEFVCVLIVTLHGGFTIQLILLLNCIIVVRYLFTFHIKNPTATQHDFWMLFLSIWSLGFGIVSQSAYIFLPGRNPAQYHVCIGNISCSLNMEKAKLNMVLYLIIIFTLCVHIFVGIRLKVYELKTSKSTLNRTAQTLQRNKNSIVTATFHLFIFTSFFALIVPTLKTALTNLEYLDEYPNYLWMYYFHMYSVECFIAISLFVMISKNPQMRTFIKREILEVFL
jgi:hypothetical protein